MAIEPAASYFAFTVALVIAAAVGLFLALYAIYRREVPGAWAMVAMALAVTVWCMGYALELSSAALFAKLFWAKVEYFSIAAIATIWFVFVVYFVSRSSAARPQLRQFALLAVVPIITMCLAWTNEWHGLIWREVGVSAVGSAAFLVPTYGPWFWVHTSYSYLLLLLGTVWMLAALWYSHPAYRRQALIVLLGMLPVWLANIIHLTQWWFPPELDLTPLAFMIAGLVYTWGIFRYQLLEIMPVAYQTIVDELADAVIVVDLQDQIVRLNPAAQQLVHAATGSAPALTLTSILGVKAVEQLPHDRTLAMQMEIVRADDAGPRFYEMQVFPLFRNGRRPLGRLIVLHNITKRRQAENALQLLNQSLEQRVAARTHDLQAEIEERKRAEAALRRSEISNVAILDAIPDLIFRIDQDGTFLDFKQPEGMRLHLSPEQFLGRRMADVMPGAITQQTRLAMRQARETRQVQTFNYHLPVVDAERYYEARMVAGNVDEYVAIIRDITLQEAARQQLRYQASLLDLVDEAIISTDGTFHIRTWNRAAEQMYGYAAHEVIGRPVAECFRPQYWGQTGDEVSEQFLRAGVWQGEVVHQAKDGRQLNVWVAVKAITDRSGRITGAVSANRDVTRARQAERALLESEARYRNLFEEAPVMYVITHNQAGVPVIIDCNEQFSTTLGLAKTEVMGRPLADFLAPASRQDLFVDSFRGARGVEIQQVERQLVRCDGTIIAAQVLIGPERTVQGQVVGTRITMVDITQRKLMEARLRETSEQLRSLAEHIQSGRETERAHIAREIHDELGQMLTALKFDVEWLAKRLPAAEPALLIKAATMSELIGATIQSVQRISAELRPSILDNLGLVAALQWQIKEFQERTEIRCCFTTNLDEDFALDPGLATVLFRIFQEALTNVARHAQATAITAALTCQDSCLQMAVVDDGVGISEKHLTDVNSLGLIGMRERLYPWQGQLTIQRAPGRGTAVEIRVPVDPHLEGSFS